MVTPSIQPPDSLGLKSLTTPISPDPQRTRVREGDTIREIDPRTGQTIAVYPANQEAPQLLSSPPSIAQTQIEEAKKKEQEEQTRNESFDFGTEEKPKKDKQPRNKDLARAIRGLEHETLLDLELSLQTKHLGRPTSPLEEAQLRRRIDKALGRAEAGLEPGIKLFVLDETFPAQVPVIPNKPDRDTTLRERGL